MDNTIKVLDKNGNIINISTEQLDIYLKAGYTEVTDKKAGAKTNDKTGEAKT